jgi:AcrR family transcriptional regulator
MRPRGRARPCPSCRAEPAGRALYNDGTEHLGTPRPRRGRPRSEKARAAIVGAAAELLLEQGLPALNMDAVAERAGASKATIYRWWPSKEVLAVDALLEWVSAGVGEHDTGSLRGDLLASILPWVRVIRRQPFGGVVAALIAKAQSDPGFAEIYRSHFIDKRREPGRTALARAISRGEAPADLDVELVLDLVYGPIYHRLLHGHAPLTLRFAGDIVDVVVTTIEQRAARP